MTASKFPYIARGNQRYNIARSKTFNIDNGSGTTDDDVILANLPSDADIVSVQAVYVEATDTAGAENANFKLGTTAGGNGIVAATALEVSKAVGAVTSSTLTASRLAAGSSLFARHTGVATTQPGQYWLEVVYMLKP
jgi:hypothetical protein